MGRSPSEPGFDDTASCGWERSMVAVVVSLAGSLVTVWWRNHTVCCDRGAILQSVCDIGPTRG